MATKTKPNTPKQTTPDIMPNVHVLGRKLTGHLKDLKQKYNALDDSSKRKLVAGIAGVTALLVGAHALKSAGKKKTDKKKK